MSLRSVRSDVSYARTDGYLVRVEGDCRLKPPRFPIVIIVGLAFSAGFLVGAILTLITR